ncbi:hypothetical protein MA16_Dca001339 [Dendrobium catenatum]|uniref:DUF4218 domain-containing protein n=1 Tax=Dendrobium catenatum TaxID=906689 RepID=A0A2I0WM54_9ASPA|nr:hypothetical protein MA16_Dca001339 [Dendrobium catenatum]
MQCLLPSPFSFLPYSILNPLIELCIFFKNLCSTKFNAEHLIHMENNNTFILCKLEKIFPPPFFDSMEHLLVHLPYEAIIGGLVQYQWMYPFER